MSIKNVLRKAAELVVELPDDAEATPRIVAPVQVEATVPKPTKTVEQIIKENPGPNLDEIQIKPEATAVTQSAPIAPNGDVDFQQVYARASLSPTPFSAEQAYDVIASLPADLPLEAKRNTVNATLQAMGKAMGVNTEGVVADAGRKVAALSAYEDFLTHQVDVFNLGLEAKIDDLKQKIAEHEAEISRTKEMLKSAVDKCTAESQRLDTVLEFFTLDKGVSSNAPK